MELTPTQGVQKRAGPDTLFKPSGEGPAIPKDTTFIEPKIGSSAGAESALMLKGLGPDFIRLRYERLPTGNFGPDAAITRLCATLSSIYEAHPDAREALRAAGFVYQGEEQLAESQDEQEGHEEDREEALHQAQQEREDAAPAR